MEFQKIVIIVALLILISLLVIVGVSLSKRYDETNWPPIIGDCPDYWLDLSGNGSACFNAKRLGKCNLPSKGNPNVMNFNRDIFMGTSGECSKYKWANECGVTWDGLTSGVSNPCSTNTSE
jgi:hypothetical protein